MTTPKLRILCVHGVGAHPPGGKWEDKWKSAIATAIDVAGNEVKPKIDFIHYDDIFAAHPVSLFDSIQACGKLLKNGVNSLFNRHRGMDGKLRWTAGMVVQWVENEKLRQQTRDRLFQRINEFNPDVICAHSLGSLVAYDTFTHADTRTIVKDRYFISLGSQIGNPFVVGSFGAGRIKSLAEAKHWFHLFNDEDAVFTSPIRMSSERFTQIKTPFDISGIADHAADSYLSHINTCNIAWQRITLEPTQPQLFEVEEEAPTELPREVLAITHRKRPPKNRALIVGINDYPDPSMKLQGCVNDSYLMSSVLQDIGFEAEDIRMVLDKRAACAGIQDRLEWLLDDAQDGDRRVFYYSGHGAQMASYGQGDVVDRMDEALVAWDFDWSDEKAFSDDEFYQLYSQLPYGVQFMSVFDCCHSGGLTRGGVSRVRGVNPPDDIRHRELRWDGETGLWLDRGMDSGAKDTSFAEHIGIESKFTRSMGTASRLRTLENENFKAKRKEQEHAGPYMPVLFYACQENEYAYEYNHGNIPHGAFTFSLAKNLRQSSRRTALPSFSQLQQSVARDLKAIGNEQHCVLVGPKHWLNAEIPVLKSAPLVVDREAEEA